MDRQKSFLNLLASFGMAAVSIIATTVLVINFLSGIVGGIWLAILGHWRSIGVGFVIGFAMPLAWSIASLPTMGLTTLLTIVLKKGSKTFTSILGFLTSIYCNALLALWVIWVFWLFMGRTDSKSIIPYLLWGYSSMMAPLSYMASKEPPESMGSTLGLFFAQLCYLICVLAYFFARSAVPWLYTLVAGGVLFSLFSVLITITMMVNEENES